jgi:hypothetical protein
MERWDCDPGLDNSLVSLHKISDVQTHLLRFSVNNIVCAGAPVPMSTCRQHELLLAPDQQVLRHAFGFGDELLRWLSSVVLLLLATHITPLLVGCVIVLLMIMFFWLPLLHLASGIPTVATKQPW